MIIYNRKGIRTARRFLEPMLAEDVSIVPMQRGLDYGTEPVIVSWGTIHNASEDRTLYNKPNAIRLSSNKKNARQVLLAAGIPVPFPGEEKFPCIGRTNYHRGGKGFWYCENPKEVEIAKSAGAGYFSAFYPKTNEHRVHVAHGLILFVQEKVPHFSMLANSVRALHIWNHNNFRFRIVRQNLWNKEMLIGCIKAIDVLGLDFGAVDVLSNAELDPPWVICEVNTAPGLEGYSINKYAEYFQWLFSEQPKEHFVPIGTRKADFVLTKLIKGEEIAVS